MVVVFGAMVAVAENVRIDFPGPVTVSTQLLVTLAAVVAFDMRGTVAGATLVGACGGLLVDHARRRRAALLASNIGQFALSAGAAAAVYQLIATSHIGMARPIATYPVTAASYLVVNSLLVFVGVRVKSGLSLPAFWEEVHRSVVIDLVFGLLGMLLGRLYLVEGPLTVLVGLAVAITAHTVFLTVVRLRQAYTRLELVYGFTRRLEGSRDEAEAVMSILNELRDLMNAETAELTSAGEDGWRRTSLVGSSVRPLLREGLADPGEVGWMSAVPVRVRDLRCEARAQLEARLGPHGVIAPLRTERTLIGTIAVGHPANGKPFSHEDLRLLEALTGHAAVSLQNGQLLGRLRYNSYHDQLTGLPNRNRFNELLSDLPTPSAVLLLDLDRFKEVNDTLGHHHGDLLLQSVASRIAGEVAHRGIVARLGGDEFGVLLPQTRSGDAVQTALSLLAALEQPFRIGELELEVTGSIGIAVVQAEVVDPMRLLQRADVAMYTAKETHSGWEMYSPDRDHYSLRRLALAGELRRAIESQDLEVHYQLTSDLRTHAMRGMEALVRWRHPRYGLVGPDQFISIAESSGLIRPLTLQVLTHALQFQRQLHKEGHDLKVSVNLSMRSVLDVNLPDQIAELLERHQVQASSLILEITESSVMADPPRTIGVLTRLAHLGTAIAVDDFGTGYSSLSYLKRLPASEVKIDRSFIGGMLANENDAAIVRSTVDLAHNLGMRAVGEGVEDKATWDALARLGCDEAQGYYVAAPLPPDQLRDWLHHHRPAVDPWA